MDKKRLHIFHNMIHESTGEQVATNENMMVHIHMTKRRSSPFPEHLLEKIQDATKAHQALERPANAGRSIVFQNIIGSQGFTDNALTY